MYMDQNDTSVRLMYWRSHRSSAVRKVRETASSGES